MVLTLLNVFLVCLEIGACLTKVLSISLDNASANTTAMLTLTPLLDGYLGCDVDPLDHTKNYHVVHQRCACHIINLIVKYGLKRLKPYKEVFRTTINFLNSPHCPIQKLLQC